MIRKLLPLAFALAAISAAAEASDSTVTYSATAIGVASTGDFAPYFIGSYHHGKTPQKGAALLDAYAGKALSQGQRFSWGFGAEMLAGYSSKNDYARYDAASASWTRHSEGPAAAWLQQLYAEVKYRGVFLTAGLKEHNSLLFDQRLSSGDFVESGNARPIPEVRVGFIDFQDIPFTRGWVQIQGEISYGVMPDDKYMEHHFNRYSYHITTDALYTYKRCYFRTMPAQPFSVTVGMQLGGMFGGTARYYDHGVETRTEKFSKSLKSFFKMLLPTQGNGDKFYEGNTLGSWDLKARYRLGSGATVSAYVQWPFEDGSGIGKCNGFDGIWGLEYRAAQKGWLTAVVAEYIDYRNQSGPMHWAPSDTPGTTITSQATGMDNYYNNVSYNSYANYGLSIGTPFLLSPLYNLDGYPAYVATRANGFHLGVEGCISPTLDYRVLFSYQRALGTYTTPWRNARTCTSAMAEVKWDAAKLLPGLTVNATLAFDAGRLRGDNFGAMLAVQYSGSIFSFSRK